MIEDVARRFLAGEPLTYLAEEKGMSYSNIWKVLRERCGDTWIQEFHDERLNRHEVVKTKVPRLLDEDTIQKVCQRFEAHRCHLHRPVNTHHKYILSSRVFCQRCGYSMPGQFDPTTQMCYYRHARPRGKRRLLRHCTVKPVPRVRADWLETAVVAQLFETFGNVIKIEEAIRRAVPKVGAMEKRQASLQARLDKELKSRERIISLVRKDLISEDDAEKELKRIKDSETSLRQELSDIAKHVGHMPTEDEIKCYVEQVQDALGSTIAIRDQYDNVQYASGKSGSVVFVQDEDGDMHVAGGEQGPQLVASMLSEADKQKLLATVFDGYQPDGKPSGIYINPVESEQRKGGRQRQWSYTIKGLVSFETVISDMGTQSSSPRRR